MEKRKRRNRKRRLLILIIALFFTTVMFTTTTYAWFTANQTVTVQTLNVNVAAQNGIQISVDGTNWKSLIQTTDITGAHGTYSDSVNQVPSSMEPVSTVGTIDDSGKMEMFYGVIESDDNGRYIITAEQDVETRGTSGKFIAFDLFFKVNADTPLYLTKNSGVRKVGEEDTGIKNASRIAFVFLGHEDAGADVEDIQALGLTDGSGSTVEIWEPNYDVHSSAAVAHARDVYGITTSQTSAAQISYTGIKAEIGEDDGVLLNTEGYEGYTDNYEDFFDDVTITYKTAAGFNSRLPIFTLTAGITKVRVYMWIEGQDVDCENSASNGDISYDLQISTEASD